MYNRTDAQSPLSFFNSGVWNHVQQSAKVHLLSLTAVYEITYNRVPKSTFFL